MASKSVGHPVTGTYHSKRAKGARRKRGFQWRLPRPLTIQLGRGEHRRYHPACSVVVGRFYAAHYGQPPAAYDGGKPSETRACSLCAGLLIERPRRLRPQAQAAQLDTLLRK